MRPLPTLLTLSLAAAFGGFAATGIHALLDNPAQAASVPAASVLPAAASLPASVAGQPLPSLAPMLERTMPAVVSINTKQVVRVRNPFFDDPVFRRLFPQVPAERINESLGSGVIIDAAKGYVLTNHHVIDNADDVQVTLADGRSFSAEFLGSDADTDVALIRIPAEGLTAITLANSDQLKVGDFVVAIGNPFGFSQTVTSGIVSALGRNQLGINTFENFIQTDAAINPGNSGGALTDINGNLMGINTAIYSRSGGSMGIGFAIPVSTAKQVMESIVKNGQVVRGWIGVEPNELTPELAQTFGIQSAQGVIVTGVLNSGPAAEAGIRPGDVITQVAGQPVRTVSELLTRIAGLTPGQATPFALQRQGQVVEVSVTPAQRPRPQRVMQR